MTAGLAAALGLVVLAQTTGGNSRVMVPALVGVALFEAAIFVAYLLSRVLTRHDSSDSKSLADALNDLATCPSPRSPNLSTIPASKPVKNGLEELQGRIERDQELILDLQTSNRLIARDQQRLLDGLNAYRDGMILIDANGHVQFANEAAGRFIRVPPSEARGRSIFELATVEEIKTLVEENDERGGSGATQFVELEPSEITGNDYVLVTAVQRGEGDIDEGHALVFQEISRLKSVERLQAQFVDSVAHELRTPLTSIRGYAEMLIDGDTKDAQTQHDFFNIIYEETHRLSQLIDNLLNISMLESGASHIDATPTRIKRILEESAEVVRFQCEKKGVSLNVALDDRLPTLDVDKSLFGMAVLNLLSNATKYTNEGGEIVITTASDDESFRIAVKDTGVGISEEDMPKVFEKFFRADSAEEVHGSGVGLSTALEIVRLHGGEIAVESELGQGSTFSIVLPRTLINTSIGE